MQVVKPAHSGLDLTAFGAMAISLSQILPVIIATVAGILACVWYSIEIYEWHKAKRRDRELWQAQFMSLTPEKSDNVPAVTVAVLPASTEGKQNVSS